jgi:quinolinate synthase
VIVFAGVSFMAEVAAILNEDKITLHPVQEAGCPLADFLDVETVKRFSDEYPDAPLVLYVNSNADTKMYADYIVTSSSAIKLISKLDDDAILFGPDKNLASYVEKRTDKKIISIPSDGYCYVHKKQINCRYIERARAEHPNACLPVPPEVSPEAQELADYIGSTSQMLRAIGRLKEDEFLLGTEEGHTYRAKTIYPEKEIYPVNPRAVCVDMKKITLENIKKSLETMKPKIIIEKKINDKIKEILDRSFRMIK